MRCVPLIAAATLIAFTLPFAGGLSLAVTDVWTITYNGPGNAADEGKGVAVGQDGSEQITYGLITALRQSSPVLLLVSLLMFGPVSFFQSARLVLLLRAQEIRLTFWESIKLTFACNFFNMKSKECIQIPFRRINIVY